MKDQCSSPTQSRPFPSRRGVGMVFAVATNLFWAAARPDRPHWCLRLLWVNCFDHVVSEHLSDGGYIALSTSPRSSSSFSGSLEPSRELLKNPTTSESFCPFARTTACSHSPSQLLFLLVHVPRNNLPGPFRTGSSGTFS